MSFMRSSNAAKITFWYRSAIGARNVAVFLSSERDSYSNSLSRVIFPSSSE